MTGALRPDLARAHLMRVSWALSLASLPMLLFARRALRQSARPGILPRGGFRLLLAACAATPLALLLVRALGWPPAAANVLWWLVPAFAALPPLLGGCPPQDSNTFNLIYTQIAVLARREGPG
jgi:hypothetical protein